MADENAAPNCCRLETVLVRVAPPAPNPRTLAARRPRPALPPQETIKAHGTLPKDEVLRGAPADELVRMIECEALQGQYLALLLAAAFGARVLRPLKPLSGSDGHTPSASLFARSRGT